MEGRATIVVVESCPATRGLLVQALRENGDRVLATRGTVARRRYWSRPTPNSTPGHAVKAIGADVSIAGYT